MLWKRIVASVLLLVLLLSVAGCQGRTGMEEEKKLSQTGSGEEQGNALSGETGSKSGDEQTKSMDEEDGYELFVDVYDSHNARITIDGLKLQESYPRNIDQLESSKKVFSWGVKFGQYEVALVYLNGSYVDTDFHPLEWEAALVYRPDSTNELNRVPLEIPLEITENYMIISLTLLDTEQIDLQQIDSYQLEGIENGKVQCDREISLSEMDKQKGAFAKNRIFPKKVYEAGYITGWGDADYFTPASKDYMLFSLGEDGRKHMLVSFNQKGEISSMVERQRISTGMKSTQFGLVDDKPTEETMISNLDGYLSQGYSDARETGLVTKSAAYIEDCLYISYDQETVDCENDMAYSSGQYMNAKDKLLKERTLFYNPEYKQCYASSGKIDGEQLVAPGGTKREEFDLLQYYSPTTEDYRLLQYSVEGYKQLDVYSFNQYGTVVDSMQVLYFENDDSMEKRRYLMNMGYQVHPDNPKIVMGSYRDIKRETNTKKDWIIYDRANAANGGYTEGENEIIYYSVPQLTEKKNE